MTICPVLILAYALLIMVLSLGMDKGFCGWACGSLVLEDYVPYSVVGMSDSDTVLGNLQLKR